MKTHEALLRGRPALLAHAERVAAKVPEFEQVALLHDVLEDTDATADMLNILMGSTITDAVVILTRLETETYADYILRVARSGNVAAVAVKRADLEDHLELADTLRPSLKPRYERALEVLRGI